MSNQKGVVETCLLKISDPFTLVVLAAYRSQELASGVTPCVATDGSKDALVSLKEISSGNLDMSSLEDRMVKSLQKFAFLSEEGLSPAAGPVYTPAQKNSHVHESASFGAHALFHKPSVIAPMNALDSAAKDTAEDLEEDEDMLDHQEFIHPSESSDISESKHDLECDDDQDHERNDMQDDQDDQDDTTQESSDDRVF